MQLSITLTLWVAAAAATTVPLHRAMIAATRTTALCSEPCAPQQPRIDPCQRRYCIIDATACLPAWSPLAVTACVYDTLREFHIDLSGCCVHDSSQFGCCRVRWRTNAPLPHSVDGLSFVFRHSICSTEHLASWRAFETRLRPRYATVDSQENVRYFTRKVSQLYFSVIFPEMPALV